MECNSIRTSCEGLSPNPSPNGAQSSREGVCVCTGTSISHPSLSPPPVLNSPFIGIRAVLTHILWERGGSFNLRPPPPFEWGLPLAVCRGTRLPSLVPFLPSSEARVPAVGLDFVFSLFKSLAAAGSSLSPCMKRAPKQIPAAHRPSPTHGRRLRKSRRLAKLCSPMNPCLPSRC